MRWWPQEVKSSAARGGGTAALRREKGRDSKGGVSGGETR